MKVFLKNLSIRYKILLPVACLGILMFVMGIFSLRSVTQIMNASEAISGNYAMKTEKIGDVTATYQTLRRVAFAHIVASGDQSLQSTLMEEADSLKTKITDTCNEFEELIDSDEEMTQFEEFKANYESYLTIYDKILDDSTNGNTEEATSLANVDLKEAGTALTAELEEMITMNKENMNTAVEHQNEVYGGVTRTIII